MIHHLEHTYDRVRPLYHALAFNLEIDAILDGNTRGQVYVDDPAAPRCALIWDQMNTLFLAGQAGNDDFNAAVNDLLTTRLIPDAAERHLGDFILYTAHEAWERELDVVLQGFAPFKARRRLYKLGQLAIDWRAELPPGARMARMDRDLLADERLENRIQVVNWITSFWPSTEDFLARGLGFCLIQGQAIASWCLAVFSSGNRFYHYFAARLWARAGSPERAFRYLDQAIDAGWDDVERLQADPDLSSLHPSDAWAVLLARLAPAS